MRKTRAHPPTSRRSGNAWLRAELYLVDQALDEIGAPTESTGVRLSAAGRIRLFAFRLLTLANQRGAELSLPLEADRG